MNDKFDELAKGMAQSVTRRAALKKFGLALAGFALALLGMANNAHATRGGKLNLHPLGAPTKTATIPAGALASHVSPAAVNQAAAGQKHPSKYSARQMRATIF